MKILVTGAKGFVGKNLCLTLKSIRLCANHPLANETIEVLECDLDTPRGQLDEWLDECDFVFHLAGVNRPRDPAEFNAGNAVFTEDILDRLTQRAAKTPILLTSSIQAELDNPYGHSKKAAEDAVRRYGRKTGALIYVYRLPNVFGKWCRPNYNSAIATWCHNIARDLPIVVHDESARIRLVHVDDVVSDFIGCLMGREPSPCTVDGECLSVLPAYDKTLGEIVSLLRTFHDEPLTLQVPNQADSFGKKLYATYLSYLPEDKFKYSVMMHCDNRGSFTELLHTAERGQFSVNISKPGVVKGQHWHHTKHEKFCVVSGRGIVRFRKVDQPSQPVIECSVSGDKIEIVRVPPGYTHNIVNEGDVDMVTLMWANEVYDPLCPDTFFEKV